MTVATPAHRLSGLPASRRRLTRPQPLRPGSAAALLALAVAGLLALPGCEKGGRIDLGQTTEAERESNRILPTALIEFSDQAPRRLVGDLATLPVIEDTEGPVTILLGDINNQTGLVSSSEFEMTMARMRNNLLNSGTAGSKLRFVEMRARMARLAERERVAQDNYIAEPADYDPQTTYTLLGDFYRVGRGETNQYYMEFTLAHFGTNQLVWSDRYDIKQVQGD